MPFFFVSRACQTVALSPVAGDLRAAAFGLASALAVTNLTTSLLKNYVGRLRPFFYQRCGWDPEAGACGGPGASVSPAMLFTLRQSFPSGHASLGSCAMVFVSLYLLGKARLGGGGSGGGVRWGLSLGRWGVLRCGPVAGCAAMLPLCLEVWVMASRLRENFHHPADVVGGFVLGATTALFWYRLGYPCVWAERSHEPLLSPPCEGEEAKQPGGGPYDMPCGGDGEDPGTSGMELGVVEEAAGGESQLLRAASC